MVDVGECAVLWVVILIFLAFLSCTYSNPSFMVGTRSGDCFKVNYDYTESSLDATIAFLPPFVQMEYIHPVNASDSVS